MIIQRTILKQEFARKLYPHSTSDKAAMQQLRREIRASKVLKSQIEEAGATNRTFYNRNQATLILKHLNVSIEEFENL